jgi:thiol-disulfide isomerase/thioredoxin
MLVPVKENTVYLNAEKQEITREAFRDSINSQKYVFSVMDTIWILEKRIIGKEVIGKKIPCTEIKDIYGNACTIGKEDKFKLVVFWNITCPPCIEELIALNILIKEFGELQIVAITGNSAKDVLAFMKRCTFKWENIVILPNYKQEFESVLEMPKIYPTSLILDKENTIKEVYQGCNLREMIVALDRLYQNENSK